MLMNLMNVAPDENDPETMLRYVETMTALDPENGEFRWFRAVLRFQTDRLAEALEETTWLLEQRPAGVELSQVRQLQSVLESKVKESPGQQ